MSCDFCGLDFAIDASRAGCAACSAWGGGCEFVRCPRCGYEMPEPLGLPRWVKRLKTFLSKTETSDERDGHGQAG